MTGPIDDFDAALVGDEKAQLRNIVRSLASQLMCVLWFKEVPSALRESSKSLAKAAIDFVEKRDV